MDLNVSPASDKCLPPPAFSIPLAGNKECDSAASPSNFGDLQSLYQRFCSLPLELRIAIFLQLPLGDLYTFSLANKSCHYVVYQVFSTWFNTCICEEDTQQTMDARTAQFLAKPEFKIAFKKGAYIPSEYFFLTDNFVEHRPFRALIENLPLGKIKKSILLDAAQLVLSKPSNSANVSLQCFVDIGLLSQSAYQNLLVTLDKSEITLSTFQWGFFRKNMLGLLFLAQKQELDIASILEIPDEALEGGIVKALSGLNGGGVAERMLKNKIFLSLHKNILFSSYEDPVIWLEKKVNATWEPNPASRNWASWQEKCVQASMAS